MVEAPAFEDDGGGVPFGGALLLDEDPLTSLTDGFVSLLNKIMKHFNNSYGKTHWGLALKIKFFDNKSLIFGCNNRKVLPSQNRTMLPKSFQRMFPGPNRFYIS